MKKIAILSAMFISGALFAAPGIVNIPVLNEKPALMDGMLDDACWKKALKIDSFKGILPQKPITEKTEAMIFADSANLYIAFKAFFKDRQAKEKEINSKGVFQCDTVEIFVDPGDTGNYSHIGIGINSAYSFVNKQASISYAVQVLEDCWQAEIAIPFASMKMPLKGGSKKWSINLARGNTKIEEFSSWAPLDKGTFHDTENFFRTESIVCDLAALAEQQDKANRKMFAIESDRILYSTQSTAKFKIDLKYDKTLKKHSIQVLVSDKQGKKLGTHQIRPVFFANEFALSLKDIPQGRCNLEFVLTDADGKAITSGNSVFWKIPPRKAKPKDLYTIKNQNMYKNGKFFFPILTWGGTLKWADFKNCGFDREKFDIQYEARLKELKSLGFNSTITLEYMFQEAVPFAEKNPLFRQLFPAWMPWNQKPAYPYSFKETLERCEKHDLALIPILSGLLRGSKIPDANVEAWLELALIYRDYENIMLWHTLDETDAEIEKNLYVHRLHKELDPDRLTWLNVINAVAPNKDAGDILSTDPYPIPNQPLTMVSSHADRLEKIFADKPNQSKWIWIQIFGGEGGWTRSPSASEMRAMVFLSMNHGIKGIAYFIYQGPERRDGKYSMKQDGYDEMARTNKQLEELAPVYCLGKRLLLKRDADKDLAVFEHDGALMISVVNLQNKEQSLELNLERQESGTASVLFENRKISVNNGRITDTFAPYAVHIYKLQGKKK